jgi:hypothetical protein
MLQVYVSSVSDVFRGLLQVFQIGVAKVDRNVAYVAMVVHVCCKCMLAMFHLCFRTYVASVCYLDVVYVYKGFQVFFFSFKCFRSMLQVLFQIF